MQTPEGRWRVEFDEPWAREGARPPEAGAADGDEGATTRAVAREAADEKAAVA
jgi:DNA topoisomerase-3